MSITITCEFASAHQAKTAEERLRRRGYMVSSGKQRQTSGADSLLVAYPYGTQGGNTPGNGLMASLPPMAGNSILLHVPETHEKPLVSVLTDDTQASQCRQLMTALGGRILS